MRKYKVTAVITTDETPTITVITRVHRSMRSFDILRDVMAWAGTIVPKNGYLRKVEIRE